MMIAFGRMNRILELDLENRRAVVQPGVVNFDLTRAVENAGLYYAPDPSSQKSCTIGGKSPRIRRPTHIGVRRNYKSRPRLELVFAGRESKTRWAENSLIHWGTIYAVFCGQRRHAGAGHGDHRETFKKPEAVKTLLAIF